MRPAFPLRLLLLTTLPLALACGGTVTDTDVEDAALSGTVNLFGRTRPAQPADADSSAVELGVRFRASVAGKASGVRFYKGRGNGGTHTGHLWSSSGQLLASTTFKSESASGWQSAVFAQPVSLTAGQLYVVSYYAPTGHYAGDNGFFAQAFTHGVLSAPKSGDGGGNGVYHYGATAFPTDSWEASNYYVDVAFLPGSTPPPPPVPDAGTPPPPVPDAGTPPPPVPDAGTPPVPDAGTPPPPSQTKNCAPNPHLCGYPDATNTGVPAGTTLRRVPEDVSSGTGWTSSGGSITVTGDGAVLDALSISGNIEIYASNVTVKRCRIVATGETWAVGLRHANNTTVEDSEMYSPTENGPARLSVAIKDIYGDMKGGTFQRNNIYHASTAIQVANGTVRDNFIHDYGFNTGDHLNGVSVGGGDVTAMLIEHNTILNQVGQTDAIALFQDFGNEANKTINDNLVGGGGYCIYAGAGSKGTPSNIRVTNNRIAVTLFPAGGSYGWLAAWDEGASTDVHSGNVWDDDSVSADGDFTGHH